MKKKLLAAAMVIAGALMASAMAAQDTSGMRYTSASEGFYASLRVQFNSGGTENAGFAIENSSSRFGVQGTNDLGNGLQGFYQYESEVGIDNGGGLSTRLAHVGLRGGFGQLQVGSFWPASYNWVHGSTDVANWASGSFIHEMLLPGRQSRALEYTTPDLNGFQAAVFIEMDPNRDGEGVLAAAVSTPDVYGAVTLDHAEIATVVYQLTVAAADDPAAAAINPADRERLLRRLVVAIATRTNTSPRTYSPTGGAMPVAVIDDDGNFTLNIAVDTSIEQFGQARFYEDTAPVANLYYFDINSPGSFAFLSEPVIFGVRSFTPGTTVPGNPKDDNDIDLWSLSSKYSFQGFDAGVSYTVAPDGLEKSSGSRKDLSLYALRLGYAQDNWYVNGWYAEDNAGDDTNRNHDTETFSLAAGIAVGKTNLYAVYEQQESDNYKPGTLTSAAVDSTGSDDDESATFGVQYNLGSRSRVWIEYVNRDYESDTDREDYTNIGLRHDL